MRPSFQGGAHHDAVHGKAEYRLFRCVQLRTGYLLCSIARTADSAAVCKDTAILAVSFSISILVLVSICIRVFPIIGLLVLLVLAWGLVNGMLLIMMYKLKNAKSDRIWIPEAA